ncbi:MAG TPA: gliding motility-associated C-terminal domain-containing protein [Cyclobacteriaceae bacterium]
MKPKRITVHPDGNIFLLGQYAGNNTIGGQALNAFPNTMDDGFLAKYNPDGDVLWVKQLFQSTDWYSNRVLDIKVDHQGDLVFSGSCLWPTSVLGSTRGTGPFLAKIDKDGNLLWLKFESTFSTADHDVGRRGNRIGFDSGNNILWFTDQINGFAETGSLTVVKYSSDGTKISAMPVTANPTFYHPYMRDFSVDADGSFVISGSFIFSVVLRGGPSLTNSGSNFNPGQFFVAKFAADGRFLWAVYSNYESNVVTGHTADQQGNIYFGLQADAGAVISSRAGSLTITNSQRSVARITADGKLDWINPVGYTNLDDLFFAPDGLLYLTGLSFGSEFNYQSYVRAKSSNQTATFILKINTEGNFYGLYLGEPEDEPSTLYGASVNGNQSVVDAAGNIYTSGEFWDRQVWACVPSVTSEYALFLVKHPPIAPPEHIITGPAVVCDGTEITLSTDLISNGVLYKWYTPERADPDPGTTLNNSITLIAEKEYNKKPVIVSITDNCDVYYAKPFVLNVPSPPLAPQLATRKELVCPGTTESFTLSQPNPDVTYQWILPDGITAPALTDAGGEFIFHSDFKTGEVKILAGNFCGVTEKSFTIGTYAKVQPPVLTGNQTLCPGLIQIRKSVTPVADALSYQWELPPSITFSSVYTQNQSTLNAIVQSDFQSGEISVRAIGQCNISDSSLPIRIDRAPGIASAKAVNGPGEICLTTNAVRYSIPSVENAITYTWTVPNLFDRKGTIVTTEPYINLKVMSVGTGSVSVFGSNSCLVKGGQTSIPITTYNPLPKPSLSISECDRIITVSDAKDFSWFKNGTAEPQYAQTSLTIFDSGRYHVEVKNFCGVQRSNEIVANPVDATKILVPNVITPNGDGKNDFFVIDKSLANPSVLIINRWGKSVYSSASYKNDWSGEDAAGNYYLVVQHECLQQGNEYKGWLSVIK